MKALLLSDIHSNLEALESVVQDARLHFDIEEVWVTGDLVGYGPNPNECLSLLNSLGAIAVAGNHDLAVIGKISTDDFNPAAAAAAIWTQEAINDTSVEMLRALPVLREQHGVSLVHGSPSDPVWEYVNDAFRANNALDAVNTAGLVTGHTHKQTMFMQRSGNTKQIAVEVSETYSFTDSKYLVNAGSVGQPRDGDPRANYAVLDFDELTINFNRVKYGYEITSRKILKAGLPTFLADRLKQGR